MRNTVQILVVFRVCKTLETFPYTPRAHQHQKIHLQHEIKNEKFSTLFSCGFGIDFRLNFYAFCSENALPCQCVEVMQGFDCQKHQNFDENLSQKHMKIMSKIFQFFISCCKCIFWCWWARGVYGNVSKMLQTRKTTKFCTVFLIVHYNRDFNTNDHLLHLFHFGAFWSSWRARAPRELTSRQIKIERNRSNPIST